MTVTAGTTIAPAPWLAGAAFGPAEWLRRTFTSRRRAALPLAAARRDDVGQRDVEDQRGVRRNLLEARRAVGK